MKNKKNKQKSIIVLLALVSILFNLFVFSKIQTNIAGISTHVRAEDEGDDDEDEDENHEDEDDEDENDDNYKDEYIYETIEVPADTQQQNITPTTSLILTVTPGFDKDTDQDKLVDALDPHPNIHESQFFTDDDKDSIPNALDEHPNEDDFLYIQFDDANNNGLLDELETL